MIIAYLWRELTVKIHIVQPGETLEGVAERYGISVEKLIQANELKPSDSLEAGMKVRIPTGRVPVAQQRVAAEAAAEPPKREPMPPKKEHRPPKKEHRPPKKEHRPPKKEHRPPKKEYLYPSSSSWSYPDRSPGRHGWESPEYWDSPRRYPCPMGEEPGYPRPEFPRRPKHHPGYPDRHRPMMPPMAPAPVYPWNPCCYPMPYPMMPMPYPMMPGPYMYPPCPPMRYGEMESDSVWYDAMGSSWGGSVRTQGVDVDDGSSSIDLWDSREDS